MADVHSHAVRSKNMAAIKGKGTRPEVIVRKYLFSQGFRYRTNDPKLPGKPDIVLPKYRTVIFVNGCFWHHHDCRYFKWPVNNGEFWKEKISRNVERDRKDQKLLEDAGWRVIVIWECELKQNKDELMQELAETICHR